MAKNRNSTPFSIRLREARKKFEVSQKLMAEKLNLDEVTYNRYETGEHIPKIDTLEKFHNITGTDLNWLITGKNTSSTGRLNLKELYPGLPDDPIIYEMIENLQVPVIYHGLIFHFIELSKKFEPMIKEHLSNLKGNKKESDQLGA
ncbi:MAG: helix-turn-helix domain-containing protein [Candidatus Omnitrophota bacterium]